MRSSGLILSLLVLTALPASATTWQEANKASVAKMNEGKLSEAFDLAWQSAELYEQSPTYKPTSHVQLLLNALDIFIQTNRPTNTPATIRKAMAALRQHVPEDDATLIPFYRQMSLANGRIGEFQEARNAQDKVIGLTIKNYGLNSPETVEALLDQARTTTSVHDVVVTRKYLDRASDIVAALDPGNITRLTVDFQQALLTLEAGRDEEAEPLFQSIVDRAEPNRANKNAATILRSAYGTLAFIARKHKDDAREDKMVEATRGLPITSGETQPLLREAPAAPDAGDPVLSGYVLVEAKVSTADGRVKEVNILEKSGDPQFAVDARTAVSKWRYQPTAPAGTPGQLITFKLPFRYQLENERPETGSRLKRQN